MGIPYIELQQKNETQPEDSLVQTMENWEILIGNFVKGYILLAGIALTLINNFIVILVFLLGKHVKSDVKKQMRLYYTALAFGDLSTALSLHATYLAGMLPLLLYTFSITLLGNKAKLSSPTHFK